MTRILYTKPLKNATETCIYFTGYPGKTTTYGKTVAMVKEVLYHRAIERRTANEN
jgi:hypothetical protein